MNLRQGRGGQGGQGGQRGQGGPLRHGSATPVEAARQRLGRQVEELARRRLQLRGLLLLQCNYRAPGGEIDIIARDGDTLVFVEVRCRSGGAAGGAAASVDARKRARIVRAARHFLCAAGAAWAQSPCRFDVVAVDGPRWRWIRGAFDAAGCA